MSHPRPKRWSIRFELAPENPEDVQLRDHLSALARKNEASNWIRRTLLDALERRVAPAFAVKNATITSPVPEVRLDQNKLPEPPKPSKPGAAVPSGLSTIEILARAAAKRAAKDEE